MIAPTALGLIDDVPKALLLALVVVLALLGPWVVLDRRSATAGAIRRAFRRSPWTGRGLVVLLAVPLLIAVAEDVVEREDDQLVIQLDQSVREAARTAGRESLVRRTAGMVSWLTGPGLVVGVLALAGGLGAARRWRDAAVLVAGTASAWLLSAGLKTLFGITRPRAHRTFYEISGYGFPSAHVLVTIVACGLLAWILGRHASWRVRLALYTAACAVAMLSGVARIILDAHWLSDVVAGLAAGLVWLTLVIMTASWLGKSTSGPLAEASGARR